ncbi:hypothetical protein NA56DRAFT_746596 [Hyaloscypha hepaticicola]|uniref:Uncharacterized protein n=1 Tax=Hyaloscypha hepaticicola TaxID=2082293 RepID=A0A2J6QBF1_9HELO|nr:hypothetical protein NA56DRAFT_746596 [Hyaloscypha hepaticicola]
MNIGYHDKQINREISIAAHALYSSEVLVIPDTHLDWQFVRFQASKAGYNGDPFEEVLGFAEGGTEPWWEASLH